MKKYMVVLTAIVMVVVLVGGAYAAPAAPTVNVSALVTPACVSSANGAMSITIDPSTAPAGGYTFSADGTVIQPQVKCTASGSTAMFTITATNAEGTNATGSLNGLLKNGTHPSIPYTLTFTPSVVGNGFLGADVGINIDGTITQLAAQAAEYSATGYTEIVTLTFNY
jgi:hypothetical protein